MIGMLLGPLLCPFLLHGMPFLGLAAMGEEAWL
jgi:hypothetical protein